MIKRCCNIFYLLIIFSLCVSVDSFAAQSSMVQAMSDKELVAKIVKLDLGFEQYRIGQDLNDEQIKKAQENSIKNRYQGTVKFKDGDIGVVADASNNTILALYIEKKEAGKEQIKNMVATLMMSFGQPTTMAHEKIVYWAFNETGLISGEDHGKAKSVDELNILATVKFNSKTRFMENKEESKDEDDQKNSIYCIISSPAMLERFQQK